MSVKNTTKVLIDGKIITLSGYESEEYLQKVASYLNNKIAELSELPGYSRQSPETRHTLLSLNIADDYFKAKGQAEMLEEDIEAKDKETYEIKHDLIAAQIQLDHMKQEREQFFREQEELKRRADELGRETEELKKSREECRQGRDELSRRAEELQRDCGEWRERNEELNREAERLRRELEEQEKRNEELSREAEELKKERGELQRKNEELNQELEELLK